MTCSTKEDPVEMGSTSFSQFSPEALVEKEQKQELDRTDLFIKGTDLWWDERPEV